MQQTQKQRIIEMVKRHADELGEHFDSVRIFVNTQDENDSENWVTYSEGRGNIFAQTGQVEEWILRQRERTKIDEWQDAKEDGKD